MQHSKKITYTINASAGANGSISPSGAVTVDCGESQAFTISPAPCYTVADVIIDKDTVGEEHLGSVTSYTFDNVGDDHTIHATFTLLTYTITPTAGEGGSIDPSNQVTVFCGENQTFTITTDIGYQLVDVLVDGDPVAEITKGPVTTYKFINVQDDHAIEAIFKKLEAWVKRYNNDSVNGNDEANDIAVAADLSGNTYVTGYSLGRTTGPDFYTLSYDSEGNEGLSKRYDGPAHDGDYANAIAVDNDGNVYATGYSFRGMAGKKHKDFATVKYNSSREPVWELRYDARRNGDDVATAIAVDNSYVYVTGRSEESLSKKSDIKHYDYYTIKYDAIRGRMKWGARYNSSGNGHDEATGIAIDSAGNVYVTGFSYNGSNNDIVTIKYNNDGNPVWSDDVRRYEGEGGLNDEAADIVVDEAGNVYVTGRSQGNGTGYDYVTIKYDTDGNLQWAKRYSNSPVIGNDEAVAIAVDAAGNVYVTGKSQGSSTGFDYVTIKYNSTGNFSWVGDVRRFDGGNSADEATDIAIYSGDVYVTGRSQGSGTGFDYHTVKYNSSGNIVWRARYNNSPTDLNDEANAIAVDTAGNVYVTGRSIGNGTGFDYATVKYEQHIEFE